MKAEESPLLTECNRDLSPVIARQDATALDSEEENR